VTEERDQDFESLLRFLRQSRGFDFTGYKRATLMRRVRKRMDLVGIKSYAEYHDHLQVNVDEFVDLFNTILINVTGFFRDGAAWGYLNEQIIPQVIGTDHEEQIRVWSAGCASGEEAYTVAMLLAEALGMPAYRDRVKIYATDVDEEALGNARQASVDLKQLSEIPQQLREKYMEVVGSRNAFKNELRRNVIFGRHDLLQDAPISRVDLLICRNTLMYFEAETQTRILARLHYSLADKGFLFLGKAEMLLTRDSIFQPVALKERVFVKVPKISLRDRMTVLAQAGEKESVKNPNRHAWLPQAASDAVPLAQIVVDADGYLVLANERARSLFGLSQSDIGRPLQDLELSYRPIELRSRLDEVARERKPLEITNVERLLDKGEVQHFDVYLAPLLSGDGLLGASITFTDVTAANRLYRQVQQHKQELETASEELESANEELETTNEELQSTVEELETTNEELQSSNEELETMNEELESTNSELQTINTELHRRTGQLDQLNIFMGAILTSLRLGVSVLDSELRVQLWNNQAEELWGVRSEEVLEQPMLRLDIGLPVNELAQPITECLTGKTGGYREITVDATNRRGRRIRCRVVCTPLVGQRGSPPEGVVILMEEVDPQGKPTLSALPQLSRR
jgi:two-component system CheB/CheR fusion protein